MSDTNVNEVFDAPHSLPRRMSDTNVNDVFDAEGSSSGESAHDRVQLFGPNSSTSHDPHQAIMRDFFPVFSSEITSSIFRYACQIDVDPLLNANSNTRWKRRFYPLWLGHVCKAWRLLAWSVPDIWTTVIIRISPRIRGIQIQIDLLAEWLQRSSGKLLDIYIEEISCGTSETLEEEGRDHDVICLLSLVAQHSRLWRTVDFHILYHRYQYITSLPKALHPPLYSDIDSTADIQENEPMSLPNLQNASLHDSQNIMRSDLPINLVHAHSLQGLSFSNTVVKPDLLLQFPTERITRLTLTQVLRLVPRQLFSQFPSLHELTLSRCSVVRKLEPDANARPITHQNLRVLHITVESEFLFNMLVHQLAFPALESLHLCVSERLRCTKFLLAFIRRSGCALRRLTVESSITADYDLIEFLSSYGIGSSIKELHVLDHDIVNPDRLRELKRNREKGPLPGLGNEFFERFHPYVYPDFLPSLEVFGYHGLLATDEVNFLESFILRSRVRDLDSGIWAGEGSEMAILRKVTLWADHISVAEIIAEYRDAKYVWEVIRMVEEGILVLLDRAGVPWS